MRDQRERQYLRLALRPGIVVVSGLVLVAGLAAVGCGDEEEEQNASQPTNQQTPAPRPDPPADPWSIETLPFDEEGGFQLRLASDGDGTLGMVFFEIVPETGSPCVELGISDPPNKVNWSLHYAEFDGGQWSTELIHALPFQSAPPGLDLQFTGQGQAVVATMTGDPISQLNQYCGVNDVGILFREGPEDWRYETAVSTSGEAASGHPSSDAGYVVGYWPGLAIDSDDQPAVAYRDVHFGGIQADDFRRADLEFVHRQGGGWSPEAVDWAEGAGQYNRLVFTDDDEPIIAHYTPTESNIQERLGYWVTWRDDGEWRRVQLFNQGNTEEPGLVLDTASETLHLFYYDSEFGTPRMASLDDWENFESPSAWSFTGLDTIGDGTYDEGYSPSLALSPGGNLAAAYYRCGRADQGLGNCDSDESALVFAYQDGDQWRHEVVDEGDHFAFCGQAPSLVFDGDEPVVAYRCERSEEERVFVEVRIARRDAID